MRQKSIFKNRIIRYNSTMLELILLVFTGIATGFLNVMAGGGSMLSLPVMIFLGIPGTIANGTNRIAILTQNISAVWAFYRKGVLIVMALPEKKNQNHSSQTNRQRTIAGHLLMVLIGFWGGFIHIGVGFLLMPVLNRVMQLDLVTTNAHKVFIVLSYTIVALLVFSSQIELIWKYGLALGIGTWLGAWLAANMQVKKGIGPIKITLNLVIVAFIIKLLFF